MKRILILFAVFPALALAENYVGRDRETGNRIDTNSLVVEEGREVEIYDYVKSWRNVKIDSIRPSYGHFFEFKVTDIKTGERMILDMEKEKDRERRLKREKERLERKAKRRG